MNPVLISTTSGPEVAAHELQRLTLTLTASQADALEDALQTFAPGTDATLKARTFAPIHPTAARGDRARFHAHIEREQLPQAVNALQSYRAEIFPGSRTVAQLMQKLQGGNPT
jgi:hypothetical protein